MIIDKTDSDDDNCLTVKIKFMRIPTRPELRGRSQQIQLLKNLTKISGKWYGNIGLEQLAEINSV